MLNKFAFGAAAIAAAVSTLSPLGGPAQAEDAARLNPLVIAVHKGDTPDMIRRQVLRNAAMARHGFVPRPRVSSEAVTPPAITSGKVLSKTLAVQAAPATPEIRFAYTAPGGFYYAEFEFTSPSGQLFYVFYDPAVPDSTAGTQTFLDPLSVLGLYYEPGKWTLTFAEIGDYTGNYTDYTATQLATLFPVSSFTLTNPNKADFTPPVVTGGKVLTKTVKLDSAYPYFKADLDVTDDVSGVAYPIVFIEPPGEDFAFSLDDVVAKPVLSGTVLSATPVTLFELSTYIGTWTIYGYGATDVAGNYFYDFSESDVATVFGTTTFTVKK